MNIKYLLPLFAAALLVACSDDDSSPTKAPDATITGSSSSDGTLLPPALSSSDVPPAVDGSSSSVLAPVANESSSSATAIQTTDENGKLIALDPSKEYTFYGSELTGKEQFLYGRFEARMKMASIPGTVSSMFLNYDNSYKKGDEPWNEIDIEVLGKSQTQWQSNIITREADPSIPGTTNSETIHDFGFDATQDFHLYTIVWTPEYVSWEIDSVEVRRDTLGMAHGTHADADQVKFLTKPQSLRFNLWASQTPAWTGKFTGIGLPIEQQIDYVRAYTYDTTSKAFTLAWQDDFEGTSLNSDRWSRGNWTMELVEYRVQNVKVSDGMARIILDYEAD
ncbi:family 16 glycosylhydrolase [uncultured Fibrobacter sp.]|uniref:family 16 glycosylhydrolase n=1 Tax=uncultured Fibrobacter sp. TaxID=261512 RepID=UPI00261E8B7B|nr:family 16 glycosylhydrolase [uncultured Fibrobacter sp.]